MIGDLPHEAFRPTQLTEEPAAGAYATAVAEVVASIVGGGLEKVVLARAVLAHLPSRVLVYGNKTVVFW